MKSFDKFLTEETKQLTQYELPYSKTDLQPVMSENTLNYHYGTLAKGYVERYNKKEGDPIFNEAGAFLHNIFFAQLQAPTPSNRPFGVSKDFIMKTYHTFNNFKDEIGRAHV